MALLVNSAGEKELPIVIGKSKSPRCFKGLPDKAKPHGIPYYANPKAWMNTSIMVDVLDKLNRKLMRQKRKVLLLLDNVSSHPPDLIGQFSNLNIVFLPKNTSSR